MLILYNKYLHYHDLVLITDRVVYFRMSLVADFEFSWKDNLFHGQYIVPAVRDQGHTSTCVFQSLCAGADMENMRTAALKDPSRTTDIKFSANRFASDYEAIAGTFTNINFHNH